MKTISRSRPTILATSILAVVALHFHTPRALAVPLTYDDGAGDNLWTSPTNWNPDQIPTAADQVTFNNLGAAAVATGVTNIVDANFTINTLNYVNTGAAVFHRTQINDGLTLAIAGTGGNALVVGNLTPAGSTTNVAIAGQTAGMGTLTVTNATGDIVVTQNTPNMGTDPVGFARLDLSGLGTFTATINEFRINTTGRSTSEVTLATTNTITADSIFVGASTVNGTGGTFLRLGQTNTLNIGELVVAAARSNSTVQFNPVGLSGTPTLLLRGLTGGVSRADLIISDQPGSTALGNGGSTDPVGLVDLTAGSVDALVDELVVGIGTTTIAPNQGGGIGTLTFDEGSINADTAVLGRTSSITADGTQAAADVPRGTVNVQGTAQLVVNNNFTLGLNGDTATGVNLAVAGTLNVSGTASVAANANLILGGRTGNSSAASTGTVVITGGTVTVGGNVTEGPTAGNNVSTVTLNGAGATLDLTQGIVNVDNFNVMSGALQNVGERQTTTGVSATVVAPITKTGTGLSVTISGTNTYTGGTIVADGNLTAATDDALGSGNVTVNSSALGPVTLTIATGVSDAIDNAATLSLETGMANTGMAILNNAAPEQVFALFLGGVAQPEGTYGNTGSGAMFEIPAFFGGTGLLLVVPEPGALLSLLGGAGLLAGLQRFRRRLS